MMSARMEVIFQREDVVHARFDLFGHATPASDVVREHGTTTAIGRIVRQFDRSGLILHNTERFKNLPASAATADPARSLPVKETLWTRLSERIVSTVSVEINKFV